MGFIPTASAGSAANGSEEPQRLWQRIAQALDRFVVYRSQRAVPAIVLRRSKHDLDRCRRLMLDGSIAPAAATPNRAAIHRAVQTAQTRS